jgi:hypothetical protein
LNFLFFGARIEITHSGIYSISISKSNKDQMIKAFEIFNNKSTNPKLEKLFEFIKESSISQSNLENIFLQVINKFICDFLFKFLIFS